MNKEEKKEREREIPVKRKHKDMRHRPKKRKIIQPIVRTETLTHKLLYGDYSDDGY